MDPDIHQQLVGDHGVQIGRAEHVTVVTQPAPDRRGLGYPSGFRPSYRAQITGFESMHARLDDRDDELDDLIALSGTDGFVVVEGDAWSGKTTLMTALGKRLRVNSVPTVQFFVVRRHSDTASAFFAGTNPQLLEMLGERGGLPPTPAEQSRQFSELWAAAAERERLVLLVDGLDEQDEEDPLTPHLPFSCPPGMAIVISTRPLPDLRRSVPREHGLASIPPARHRLLQPSPHARIERDAADDALDDALAGDDDLLTETVGFLTFGLGPLRVSELGALCGEPPGRIRRVLAPVERLLRTVGSAGDEEPAHTFGHTELEERARAWFGDLAERSYTDRILAWSDGYRDAGWPADTPAYLVQALDAVTLSAAWRGDHLSRLMQLTDRSRGQLLRARLGHAQPAVETARAARAMLASSARRDRLLEFQFGVAEHDHRCGYNQVPTYVIAALAASGQIDLALTVADASTDPWGRNDHQLAAVVAAIAETDPVRATTLARSIEGSRPRAVVAVAVANIDHELALEIALDIRDVDAGPQARLQVLAAIAETDVDRAIALIDELDRDHERTRARVELAARLADVDDDRALWFARRISDPRARAAAIGGVIAAAGRLDAIDEALATAMGLADEEDRAETLGSVARHIAADDVDTAVRTAAAIPFNDVRSPALADIAVTAADTDLDEALRVCALVGGDHDRISAQVGIATALSKTDVEEALRVGSLITDHRLRKSVVTQIAALVAEEDVDRALEIVDSLAVAETLEVASPAGRVEALSAIARVTGRADVASAALALSTSVTRPTHALVVVAAPIAEFDVDRALHVLEHVRDEVPAFRFASTLTDVVRTVGRADPDRALSIVKSVGPEEDRNRLLIELVAAVAESDTARAGSIVADVIPDDVREDAIVALSIATARSSVDDALHLMDSLSSGRTRVRTLAGLVSETGREDLVGQALDVARGLPHRNEQSAAQEEIAIAVAHHDVDRALAIAPVFLNDKTARARVLGGIARASAATDLDRAVKLAHDSFHERHDRGLLGELAVAACSTDLDRALELAANNVGALGRIARETGIVDIAADALERTLHLSDDAARARALASVAGDWPDPVVRRSMLKWLVDRWVPPSPSTRY